MAFKVGDKVRIKEFREEYRRQRPAFVEEMQELVGREFTIEYVTPDEGWILFRNFYWHEDWLESAEEEEEAEEDIDFAAFEAVIHSFMKV